MSHFSNRIELVKTLDDLEEAARDKAIRRLEVLYAEAFPDNRPLPHRQQVESLLREEGALAYVSAEKVLVRWTQNNAVITTPEYRVILHLARQLRLPSREDVRKAMATWRDELLNQIAEQDRLVPTDPEAPMTDEETALALSDLLLQANSIPPAERLRQLEELEPEDVIEIWQYCCENGIPPFSRLSTTHATVH